MKLHLNKTDSSLQITECKCIGDRFRIKVGDTFYDQSIILSSQKIEVWVATRVSDITEEDFSVLSGLGAELIILGTGPNLEFPSARITKPAIQQGLGVAVMDTAAACRTYNILKADDRNVAAAIIL